MSVNLVFTGHGSPETVSACKNAAKVVSDAVALFMNNETPTPQRIDAALTICHGLLVLQVMAADCDRSWLQDLRNRVALVLESVDVAVNAAPQRPYTPAREVH